MYAVAVFVFAIISSKGAVGMNEREAWLEDDNGFRYGTRSRAAIARIRKIGGSGGAELLTASTGQAALGTELQLYTKASTQDRV